MASTVAPARTNSDGPAWVLPNTMARTTLQRARERRNLAAAVAGQLHVRREQRLGPSKIAALGGCKEPGPQLRLLLARGLGRLQHGALSL